MSRAARAALALLVAAGARAVPAAAQAAAPLALERCAAGSDRACLRVALPLPAAAARAAGALDSAAERARWSGQLAGQALVGPGVRTPTRVEPPLRLLVVLDLSGSMIGEGIAFTRSALASFVAQLDSATVRVGVASFESRQVAARIRAARFLPPAEAAAAIRALPAPDVRGNTALYSAFVEGLGMLDAAVGEAAGAQGALLLVTDGRNDVDRPGDDPGLLSGPAGLAAAQAAAARAPHQVWLMGVGGNIPAEELTALAGARGTATIAALDPSALNQRLQVIARQLRAEREFVFGLPAGLAGALARSARRGSIDFTPPAGEAVRLPVRWQPPLAALPPFAGTVPAGELPTELADALAAGSGGGVGVRPLVALFLLAAGCLCWLVLPRLLWVPAALPSSPAAPIERPVQAPAPAAARAAAAKPAPAAPSVPAAATAAPGAVHPSAREAPPRRPDQVTAQSARRVAPA